MHAGSSPQGTKRPGSPQNTSATKRLRAETPSGETPGATDHARHLASVDDLLAAMLADCRASPNDALPIKTDALRLGFPLARSVQEFHQLLEHVDAALLAYFEPLGPVIVEHLVRLCAGRPDDLAAAGLALLGRAPLDQQPTLTSQLEADPGPCTALQLSQNLSTAPQHWRLSDELTTWVVWPLANASYDNHLPRSQRAFARAIVPLALTDRYLHRQLNPLLQFAREGFFLADDIESDRLDAINHRLLKSGPSLTQNLSLRSVIHHSRQSFWLSAATRSALGSPHAPYWLHKLFLAAARQASGTRAADDLNHLALRHLPHWLMAWDPKLNTCVMTVSEESAEELTETFDPAHPPVAWMVEHFTSFDPDTRLLLLLTLELNFEDVQQDIDAIDTLVGQLLARLDVPEREALNTQLERWRPLFERGVPVDGPLMVDALDLLGRLPLIAGEVCIRLLSLFCHDAAWRKLIGQSALVRLLTRLLEDLLDPRLHVDEMVLDYVVEGFPSDLMLLAFNHLPGEWRIHLLSHQYGEAYNLYMEAVVQASDIHLNDRQRALDDMIERVEEEDDEHACLVDLREMREQLAQQQNDQEPMSLDDESLSSPRD